jgi:uncharacterized protein YkwD
MKVTFDNRRTTPGKTYEFNKIVYAYNDNDEELICGLYDFEKVGELEEYDYEAGDSSEVVYKETKWDTSLELMSEITLPEEEGWYRATAVVADRSGNAVTSDINFVVDGTGPTITVPNENVTLSRGMAYDFAEDIDVEDNLYPADRCTLSIDEDEFDVINNALKNEEVGTYPLTYTARDLLGNESTLVIQVTIEKKSSKTSSGTSSGNSSSSSSSWDAYAEARASFDRLNEYRAQAGLSALTWNDTLYQAALIRSQELPSNMSHTRPDGSDCFTVFTEVGATSDISTIWGGENIARLRSSSGIDAMDGWYGSDGHRANMLKAEYTQAAVAVVYVNGMYYWTTLFMG